jgi:hypothetical protein
MLTWELPEPRIVAFEHAEQIVTTTLLRAPAHIAVEVTPWSG